MKLHESVNHKASMAYKYETLSQFIEILLSTLKISFPTPTIDRELTSELKSKTVLRETALISAFQLSIPVSL